MHPLVPQPGSDNRRLWASQMGFSATTLPGCVSDHALDGTSVQDNDGSGLQRTVAANGSEDITLFSIASWIGQSNSATTGAIDRRRGAVLEDIDGIPPCGNNPIVLNPHFPHPHPVFNVFPTSRLAETDIRNAFVGSTSKVCTNTATITKYGFGTDPNCGATTLTGGLV